MTTVLRAAIRRIAALCVAIVMVLPLFTASEQLGKQQLFPGPVLDKVAHAGYFGLLATALDIGLARRSVVPALLVAGAIGGADELHQRTVPGRVADVLDWLADLAGAAAVASWRARRRRKGSS
jgi:VanZ family protein